MASQLPEGCTRLFAGIRNPQMAGFLMYVRRFFWSLVYPPCLVDSVVLCALASTLLPYLYISLRAEGVKCLRLELPSLFRHSEFMPEWMTV